MFILQRFTGSNPSDQGRLKTRQDNPSKYVRHDYDSDSAVVSLVVLFDIDYDVYEGYQFMKMKI